MVVNIVGKGCIVLAASTAVAACQPGAGGLMGSGEVTGLTFSDEPTVIGVSLTEVSDPSLAEFGPLYVPTEFIAFTPVAESNPQIEAMWRDRDGDGVRDWTVEHELVFEVSFQDAEGGEQFWTGLLACRAGDCGYVRRNLQEYTGVFIAYADSLVRQDPSQIAALTGTSAPQFLADSWFVEDNLVCQQVNYLSATGQVGNYTNCGAGIAVDGTPYVVLTKRPGGTARAQTSIIEAIDTALAERLAAAEAPPAPEAEEPPAPQAEASPTTEEEPAL